MKKADDDDDVCERKRQRTLLSFGIGNTTQSQNANITDATSPEHSGKDGDATDANDSESNNMILVGAVAVQHDTTMHGVLKIESNTTEDTSSNGHEAAAVPDSGDSKCSMQAVHHSSVSDDTVLRWLKKYPFLIREIRDQQDVFFCKVALNRIRKTN